MGTLFKRFAEFYYPQTLHKLEANEEKLKLLEEAIKILENLLENTSYVAGDQMTVADISIVATINTCDFTGYNFSKHTNINRWYTLMKKNCPGWSANLRAAAMSKHDIVKVSYE
jgi:glutathione S-transferase